jgi:hypothetical protein
MRRNQNPRSIYVENLPEKGKLSLDLQRYTFLSQLNLFSPFYLLPPRRGKKKSEPGGIRTEFSSVGIILQPLQNQFQ